MSRPAKPKVYRPGKTQEDRMSTGERPRVQAAQLRRERMLKGGILLPERPPWTPEDKVYD